MEPEEDFVYRTRRDPRAMDPAMRRMALGAGGASLLVIVVALLWSGVRGSGFGPPPVITAPPGPLRIAPVNPGGLVVPEANVPIMSGVASVAPPQLAPGAPTPDISQLDQDAGIGAPPPPPVLQTAPTPDIAQLDQEAGVGAPHSAAPPSSATQATSSNAPLAPGQSARDVAVQLAATGSEAGAQAVWNALKLKMPALLGRRDADIIPAVVSGRTVWRLRIGGFADLQAARDFCASVQAQGAACTVAVF
ncbi:SPOR domain-containing protein [Acidocella sp.]|uniref:SPOR domain-containing protein n=1 Tax=Acidocella sp. TaxID=50710 RepID=UPI002F425F83